MPIPTTTGSSEPSRSSPWRSASGPSPRRRPGSGRSWARAWAWCCYDRVARLGGVAHIVLPSSRGAVDHPGKYADTAIPAVIAELERRLGIRARSRLTAKLAGGASMFQVSPDADSALEHRPQEPGGHRADPRRSEDSRRGPRPRRDIRSPIDSGHRLGHGGHQGSGRSGLIRFSRVRQGSCGYQWSSVMSGSVCTSDQ